MSSNIIIVQVSVGDELCAQCVDNTMTLTHNTYTLSQNTHIVS